MKTFRFGCLRGEDGIELDSGPTLNGEARGEGAEIVGEPLGPTTTETP